MEILELIRSCVNVVFSVACPVCGKHTAEYPVPICRKCRKTLISEDIPREISSPHIASIISCRPYSGTVRKCIKLLKYHRQYQMIHAFEQMLQNLLTEHPRDTGSADLIVPVPIHRKRRRERGFNQAELIAKLLSKLLSIPVRHNTLVKTRNTPPQTGLSRKHRYANLKNSFSVLSTKAVTGKSVILVDDVITTGATLDICAAKILTAGAKSVSAVTLARTL